MQMLLSTYESRDDIEPMVALEHSQALGAELRVSARPDFAARVATGVMSTGVWR